MGECDELVVAEPLLAQLDDFHAAGDRRSDGLSELVTAWRRVADEVEPCGAKALSPLGAEVRGGRHPSKSDTRLASDACL